MDRFREYQVRNKEKEKQKLPWHILLLCVLVKERCTDKFRSYYECILKLLRLGGVSITESPGAGLGICSKQALNSNSVVMAVPSSVALSIESPGEGPDDRSVLDKIPVDRKDLASLPWFAQFAVYLYKLDKVDPRKNNMANLDMKPWLDSLPRTFDTPIHWTLEQRAQLQYDFLQGSIPRQEQQWKQYYDNKLTAALKQQMSWQDFVWGCEVARSRAFSGTYTGSAFNPLNYAFTLLLVLVYVGLDFGTLEQAANGAGLVFCAQVLKDFVLPKLLFKKKRYIICPLMDMANHKSYGTTAGVSFEFFGDVYSLTVSNGVTVSAANKELFISYGTRSNDQLLQYYGFVEPNNPHDVYIMPPLRNWNIGKLEQACGRTFAPGRLQKLERAGLLGTTQEEMMDVTGEDAANNAGGVVVTRAGGVDPAVMQAIRALVASDKEWQDAGESIGNFVEENSAGPETERLTRLAVKVALEMELADKPTTLEQDEECLKNMNQIKSLDAGVEERLAVLFRMEKKKLLMDTIRKLS
jgi:Rubisco LSMT substrate-binding